jgi:glycosyltransferase involved in cell wall biosynthesis
VKPLSIAFDAKRAFHNSTGLGNYSRFVLEGLANEFPSERYLLMNPKKSSLFHNRNEILNEFLPEGRNKILPALWRSFGMASDLKKQKVDIYHGLSNELPLGLKKNNIASAVTIHDIIFESHPQYYKPIDRKSYRWKFKSAAQNADLVISVSQYTSLQLQERYLIPAEKIQVHYQSCHPAFYSIENQTSKKSNRLNVLPSDYILSVGTVEERKNLMGILKAIESLDIALVVVGRGKKYLESCKEYIRAHKMDGRVHFIEKIEIDDLVQLYKNAMAFVYPSRIEGFGIPIIEALFSECPVVSSEGGVFPEAGGPNSIYVNPESFDSIQKGIEKALLFSDRQQRTREGLLYAKKNFLPQPLIQNLMHSYRSLI